MNKHFILDHSLSREYLSNPHPVSTHKQRLIESHAVDLTNNYKMTDFGNGYSSIVPLDETKYIK